MAGDYYMTVGLQIFNPSDILTVSADAAGYRYLGQPTLISAGSVTAYHYTTPPYDYYWGSVAPYTYQITLPSSGFPLVGLVVSSGSVVNLRNVYNVSGNTWQIEVDSFNSSYSLEDLQNMVLVAPTVYVFCPYSNADAASGAGLQLFDSSGNLTFTTRFQPLWLKTSVNMSYAIAEYDGSSWTNLSLWQDGQSISWSPVTSPVLLNANGQGMTSGIAAGSGETIFTGSAGWTVSGSNLIRKRYIYNRETRPIETEDYLVFEVYATTPLFVSGNTL